MTWIGERLTRSYFNVAHDNLYADVISLCVQGSQMFKTKQSTWKYITTVAVFIAIGHNNTVLTIH